MKNSTQVYKLIKITSFISNYTKSNAYKGQTKHYNKRFRMEFDVFLDSFIQDESIIKSFRNI